MHTTEKMSKGKLSAVVLYAALTVFIWVNCLLSSTASVKLTSGILGALQPVISLFYNPVPTKATAVVLTSSVDKGSAVAGEPVTLSYNASANLNADDVEWALSNDLSASLTQYPVTIDEATVITAEVTLRYNTAVKVILQTKTTKTVISTIILSPKHVNYTFLNICLQADKKTAVSSAALIFDTDKNYGWATSFNVIGDNGAYEKINWSSSDESVFTVSANGFAVARGVGSATLTATAVGSGVSTSIPITVSENVSRLVPTGIIIRNVPTDMYVGDVYHGTSADWFIQPSGARASSLNFLPYDSNTIRYNAGNTYTALKAGSVTFTVYISEKPEIRESYTITVHDRQPQNLRIESSTNSNKLGFYATVLLNAVDDNSFTGGVTWSSDNENIATVSQKGIVSGLNLGKTTIRATSIANPEHSAEFVVRVGIVGNQSLALVARKFLGHGGMFFALGFLSVLTYWGLFNRRWKDALIGLGAGLFTAALSEVFQLPFFTTGRYASYIDAIIDYIGFVGGTAFAFIVCYLVLYIKKKKPLSAVADGKPLILFGDKG